MISFTQRTGKVHPLHIRQEAVDTAVKRKSLYLLEIEPLSSSWRSQYVESRLGHRLSGGFLLLSFFSATKTAELYRSKKTRGLDCAEVVSGCRTLRVRS